MIFPQDCRYTPTHEWVRLEDDLAVVGLTDYAAQQLSDITYIELPDVGEDLAAEAVLGTVESVKAAADLLSPIDGEVIEVNEAIVDNPEPIGRDPYDDGWLVKLKPLDPSQIEGLLTVEEYQVLLQAEVEEEEEEEEEPEEEEEHEDLAEVTLDDAADDEKGDPDAEKDDEEEDEEAADDEKTMDIF